MKSKTDPRHQKRVDRMKKLFSFSFNSLDRTPDDKISSIVEHISKIDGLITECAPEWPINQINRIDEVLAPFVAKSYDKQYQIALTWGITDAKAFAIAQTEKECHDAFQSLEYEDECPAQSD